MTFHEYKIILKATNNTGGTDEKSETEVRTNGKRTLSDRTGRKVGVTRQTIGMMEAGDYNPSLKLCTAICRELGKTLNDLFWEAV